MSCCCFTFGRAPDRVCIAYLTSSLSALHYLWYATSVILLCCLLQLIARVLWVVVFGFSVARGRGRGRGTEGWTDGLEQFENNFVLAHLINISWSDNKSSRVRIHPSPTPSDLQSVPELRSRGNNIVRHILLL